MPTRRHQPTVGEELNDRAAQREKIAAVFKAHPLEDIEPEQLRKITPHYQQRISELRCKGKAKMRIVNVPRSEVVDGKTHKRDGAYRYESYERLGRDAGDIVPAPWNQDRPFAIAWTLTPQEIAPSRRRGSNGRGSTRG